MIDTLPIHHLSRVLSLLKRGEVVAFPTGTTYGFGVNALDTSALQKLTALKGREAEKTYSLLLPANDMGTYVELSAREGAALKSFSDRPLTLLVKAKAPLASLAKDGRVGVRTPDHPFTKELVALLAFPVTATSANRSGHLPALSIEELLEAFRDASFMAVDGGELPKRKPSTVAAFSNGSWTIMREGDVRAKDLNALPM